MKHLPIYNTEFERLNKEFAGFVRLKGYSRGKNTSYAYNVREFLFFSENRGIDDIRKVIATDVISYYEYLRERPNQRKEGGLSESMIRGHLFSLRLFFDYLMDIGEIEASPAHLPKFSIGKANQRQILTLEEVKEINNACVNIIEKALMAIAYGCGLRRNELELLDMGDVLLHKGLLIVREGKGGKSRTIPLSDTGIKTLREYIVNERAILAAGNSMEVCNAFFINKTGTRMKSESLANLLKEVISRTKNQTIITKNITLHCLRHSIATHLLDNGAEIEFVQEFLGHEEMDTSHLYSKRRKQHLKMYNEINRPSYASASI